MNTKEKLNTTKIAKIAGFLYLMVMVSGVFANLYVHSRLIVLDDATATANNIMALEFLFRTGFVSELIHMISFFFLTITLYLLLKPVNKNFASLLVLFVLVAVPIEMLNSLNNLAALILFGGADYLKTFTADQLNTLAMVFLNLFEYGYFIAQIFMGLWMLPLGVLVFRSGFFPRFLGILFIIGCFGLLIGSFQYFLFPGYQVITYPGLVVSILAEILFCFWLLVKGTNIQQS